MNQLTREQAVALYDSEAWRAWTPQELAAFQSEQDRLCVPFAEYQNAMSVALGRPVFTHEFADREAMRAELEGKVPKRSLDDILAAIPPGKLILVQHS
jgi:hypothetical protein